MFAFFQTFRDFIWGIPLIALIMGTGILLTVLTRGFQFRHLWLIIKSTFTKAMSTG